jgi:hypothetical protein
MPSALRAIPAAAASCFAVLLLAACTGGGGHSQPATPSAATPHLTHTLPPGFSAPGSTVFPSTSVLQVAPVTDLNPAALHPGPFPVGQVKGITQAIVNQPVQTLTRPLLVSVSAFRTGQTVTVAASDLGSAPHDVLFILEGPGLRAQRLVRASHGASAVMVTLPATLAQGTWALAAEDLSGVHAQGTKRPTGTVLLDLTVFTLH